MANLVTIIGSTGSIGESTLRVIRSLGDEFSVYGLACGGNLALLEEQINEFHPTAVAVGLPATVSTDEFREVRRRHPSVEFMEGEEGVVELAGRDVDTLVSAIVGAAGLRPTLAAVGAAKRIALANKETLVIAGDIVMRKVEEAGAELIPVDSEHSALFSMLRGIGREDVRRIVLTASGGSLRDVPVDDLPSIEPERALRHPTWEMGEKITIDSATLMNKGFEVIEAHHLFSLPFEKIDVVIHPESVVHSLVETEDGSLYSHMGIADMALPIWNALTYPARKKNTFGRLSLEEVGSLTFRSCDVARYPALDLCFEAGKRGGTLPAVLNGANEEAVHAFLQKKILFTEIVKIVEKAMGRHQAIEDPTMEEIFLADAEAREISRTLIRGDYR